MSAIHPWRTRAQDLLATFPERPDQALNVDESKLLTGRYHLAMNDGSLTVGDIVYAAGNAAGGLAQVAKCDPYQPETLPATGIVERIVNAEALLILSVGEFVTTGLIPQRRYWVGADGRISDTMPPRPLTGLVGVQWVGKAIDERRLFFRTSSLVLKLRPA